MESEAVEADLEDGTASLHVRNLNLRDFFNIPNALFHNNHPGMPESVPATVSFKLDWVGPVTSRFSLNNPLHHFRGRFVANSARMEWSARRPDGFQFVSDAAKTSKSVFSEIGRVRNGVFFNAPEDSRDD